MPEMTEEELTEAIHRQAMRLSALGEVRTIPPDVDHGELRPWQEYPQGPTQTDIARFFSA